MDKFRRVTKNRNLVLGLRLEWNFKLISQVVLLAKAHECMRTLHMTRAFAQKLKAHSPTLSCDHPCVFNDRYSQKLKAYSLLV